IVRERSAQTQAEAITPAIALLPIIFPRGSVCCASKWGVVAGLPPLISVAKTNVSVELDFGNRGGHLPFSAAGFRNLLRQFGADFLRFLVGNKLFLNEQVEECAGVLPKHRHGGEQKRRERCNQGNFFKHDSFLRLMSGPRG